MGIVYHYTNSVGLLGIVGAKKLWCSNVRFLNDSREFEHGVDLLLEALHDLAADKTALPDWPGMADEMGTRLRLFWDDLKAGRTSTQIKSFAACFSRAADDLSQWRAYSSPGARYAIGFHEERLADFARVAGMRLSDVEYRSSETKQAFRSEIENALSGGSKLYSSGTCKEHGPKAAHWPDLMGRLLTCLTLVGVKSKDAAFEKEREVRMWNVFPGIPRGTRSFRPGGSSIVPYAELDLSDHASMIASVMIGPNPHQALAAEGVFQLLHQMGPQNVHIELSAIPYRDH